MAKTKDKPKKQWLDKTPMERPQLVEIIHHYGQFDEAFVDRQISAFVDAELKRKRKSLKFIEADWKGWSSISKPKRLQFGNDFYEYVRHVALARGFDGEDYQRSIEETEYND